MKPHHKSQTFRRRRADSLDSLSLSIASSGRCRVRGRSKHQAVVPSSAGSSFFMLHPPFLAARLDSFIGNWRNFI